MKQLLLSISVALLIHAILLFGEFSRLQLFSVATPELKSIDISLVAYSPPPQPEIPRPKVKGLPLDKAPAPIEKMEDPLLVPHEQLPPPTESSEPPIATPPAESAPDDAAAEPEEAEEAVSESELREPTAVSPSLESPSKQTEKVADEPEQAAPVRRKPKRNLKALTKVTQKTVAATMRMLQPKLQKRKHSPKNDKLASSPPSTVREKPKPETVKAASSAATEPRKKPTLTEETDKMVTSAVGDMADRVASLNKQAPAAKLLLAKPLYQRNPPPKYPTRARRRGLQGVVILEVLVDESGQVEELTVFTSSGHKILDKAARASVKKWLFQPGTKGGKNAKMWVRVPIRFKLNE